MTPRVAARRVVRATLAVALPLAVLACTAPPTPTVAPPARPADVVAVPATGGSANDICTVRRSYPASPARPSNLGDRLVVGVDPSDATMSHWNAKAQTFEGFNIELVRAVASALWPDEQDPLDRVSFQVVPPGAGSFPHLEPTSENRVDMVATSLTASCDRAEKVVFSNDYLDSGQTALVRKVDDRPEFRGMEELGGRRVCAAAGTTSLAAVVGYRTADGRRLVPVRAKHAIDCLVMLREKQVDAVSTDENILLGFTRMAPDVTLVTEPPPGNEKYCGYHLGGGPDGDATKPCTWFTDEPHAFAFHRDNLELVRFVNQVLADTRASGAWERAHEKWLREHPDRGMPSPGPTVASWPPPRE